MDMVLAFVALAGDQGQFPATGDGNLRGEPVAATLR